MKTVAFIFLWCFCFTFGLRTGCRRSQLLQTKRWAAEDVKMNLPFKRPQPQNAAGNLFVDESCIDCDVCRWMCPGVYKKKGIKSVVHSQPVTHEQKLSAFPAMVACPVGAIRTHHPDPIVKEALDIFPAEIDASLIPGVCHAGYHSADSFGATPYFIRRRGGNIMIDCPRFNSRLANTIEAEGGLSYMILTHQDDVADHDKWKKRFPNLLRFIHRLDVTDDTQDCEVRLDGFDQQYLAPDVLILHTPGHTAGSMCVLFEPQHPGACALIIPGSARVPASALSDPATTTSTTSINTTSTTSTTTSTTSTTSTTASTSWTELDAAGSNAAALSANPPTSTVGGGQPRRQRVLFTGDHLAYSEENQALTGFRAFNHGSIDVQVESIAALAVPELQFDWILPGHGRMMRFSSQDERQRLISQAAQDFLRKESDYGGLAGLGFL